MHPSVRVRRSTSLLLKIAEMFEESLVLLLRERIFLALHRLRRKKLRRMNGERKEWRGEREERRGLPKRGG